jgi:hypothetical protein
VCGIGGEKRVVRCFSRASFLETFFTLRRVTRSAAWRSVRADMSSTILWRAGSEGDGAGVAEVELELGDAEGGGGGGGDDDDDAEVVASAVAVASARTRIHARVLRAETLRTLRQNQNRRQ